MPTESNKAIFLDRDGVLIRERGEYTWLLEDVEINNGVIPALKEFAENNFRLVIISNQGGIARGLFTCNEADYIHLHLQRNFSFHNIVIDEFYFCPHHPSAGKCLCRKPLSLLIEKAIARFRLDPSLCWFIGDADRDIDAGNAAGVKSIKVEVNGDLLPVAKRITAQG
jgi:D-glycero-D-manno-heptose 1,7-bisphosphate phosphatase